MVVLRKALFIIVLLTIASVFIYRLGKNSVRPSTTSSIIEVEKKFTCPYYVDSGIYKEYIRSANETEVIDKPELIKDPQVVKRNKPFILKDFEQGLYAYGSDKGWDYRDFDVDGDGKKERIYSGNVAMNHTPHLALIVKNGNIIFEAPEAANIFIVNVYGGQGFLLSKTVDWNTGETMSTRYIYKDGGFMPVWTQKACWVTFK